MKLHNFIFAASSLLFFYSCAGTKMLDRQFKQVNFRSVFVDTMGAFRTHILVSKAANKTPKGVLIDIIPGIAANTKSWEKTMWFLSKHDYITSVSDPMSWGKSVDLYDSLKYDYTAYFDWCEAHLRYNGSTNGYQRVVVAHSLAALVMIKTVLRKPELAEFLDGVIFINPASIFYATLPLFLEFANDHRWLVEWYGGLPSFLHFFELRSFYEAVNGHYGLLWGSLGEAIDEETDLLKPEYWATQGELNRFMDLVPTGFVLSWDRPFKKAGIKLRNEYDDFVSIIPAATHTPQSVYWVSTAEKIIEGIHRILLSQPFRVVEIDNINE